MAAAPAANTPPLQIDDKSMLPDTCYSKRPDGITTDTIVIHYTSAIEIKPADPYNLEAILDLFKGKIPGNPPVSSHYLIARDGKILLLVPESMRAWHAGFSTMPPPDSRDNVNDFSIGIELMATANDSVTDAQYTSLILLIKDIQTRYKIPLKNVVGHDTIRLIGT